MELVIPLIRIYKYSGNYYIAFKSYYHQNNLEGIIVKCNLNSGNSTEFFF
jgi:hypothetical protein